MDVYCISLEKNKSKWPTILEKLKSVGFDNAQIFQAVNGKNFENPESEEVHKYGSPESFITTWTLYNLKNNISRKFHEQIPSWGAIGCSLSHATIWQNLLESSNDRALIFEDDVGKFDKNFKKLFQDYLNNLPADMDVAFLDVYKNYEGKKVNDYVNSIKSQFFGTHAYIITKIAVQNFFQKFFPIEIQIDSFMFEYAQMNNMKMYTSSKHLCTQAFDNSSSIQDICILCMFNNKNVNYILIGFSLLIVLSALLLFFLKNKNFFLNK